MDKKIKVALFGTCRLTNIRRNYSCTDFDNAISFVHTTREIIQLMKFITKQIEVPDTINPFCFRTGILNRKPVSHSESFLSQFTEADLFVIEISAMKNYVFQGYYLHHLAVDRRLEFASETPEQIVRETEVLYQDREEIEKDIAEIMRLVHPRKILIASHINATIEMGQQSLGAGNEAGLAAGVRRRISSWVAPFFGKDAATPSRTVIGRRARLITLLSDICREKGVDFFDPTVALSRYREKRILQTELPGLPPGHYTDFGNKVMSRLYAEEIRRIMRCP
ncbi:MAG: hypothetical protein EG826_03830 [Deltaproteobacteria bacterium]|nr:hypothetical protein [Deltaproteobacteria bacterium]